MISERPTLNCDLKKTHSKLSRVTWQQSGFKLFLERNDINGIQQAKALRQDLATIWKWFLVDLLHWGRSYNWNNY